MDLNEKVLGFVESLGVTVRAISASTRKNVVIGVAGGTCSGKSIFASALVEEIKYGTTLSMDDYYYGAEELNRSLVDLNFDEPSALDLDLLCLHLREICNGRPVRKPIYDFETHSRKGFEMIEPCRLVVLDGLFALNDKIRPYLDFGIFVDCSDEERLRRRIERDLQKRGRTRESIIRQYDATVREMHELHIEVTRSKANIVVRNE